MMTEDASRHSYVATIRFLRDHPDWLPILKACLSEAWRTGEHGFAGAWVLQEAKITGNVRWFPNLRPLVTAGILERRDVTRGGRRAYYVMLDAQGVEAAIKSASS